MPDEPANQLLDDVLLDQYGAERTGQIGEQCGEAVVQVRMNQDLDRLCRRQRDRLEGLRGCLDVIVPNGAGER